MGPKYYKVFKSRVNPNLVESLADIKLYKDFSPTYLG